MEFIGIFASFFQGDDYVLIGLSGAVVALALRVEVGYKARIRDLETDNEDLKIAKSECENDRRELHSEISELKRKLNESG